MTKLYSMRDPANYKVELLPIPMVPIPPWIVGAYMDANIHFDGDPKPMLFIKHGFEPTSGEDLKFEYRPIGKDWLGNNQAGRGVYIAETPDGRCVAHYASAPFFSAKHDCLVTRQEDGYGGRHFVIPMKDGQKCILRGPWNSGAPEGYTDISFKFAEEDGTMNQRVMGFFGLCIKNELYNTIVAHFMPDWYLARITTLDQKEGKYNPKIAFVHKDDQTDWKASKARNATFEDLVNG